MPSWLISILSSLVFWEWAEYISGAVVVVGVIGEYIADFRIVGKTHKDEELKTRLGKISTVVLVVGLVVEIAAVANINMLAGRQIEQLKKENNGTLRQLEDEKSERLALEQFLSPRQLGDQATFNVGLAKYPGITAVVDVIRDSECRRLAGQLVFALKDLSVPGGSQWVVQYNSPVEEFTLAGDGITVEYNVLYWRRPGDISGPAAHALADLLNARGIDANAFAMPGVPGAAPVAVLPQNTIHIAVGLKPTRTVSETTRKARRETKERFEKLRKKFGDAGIQIPSESEP